ncbi:hypothetical protein PIB30_067697 [Stylosanthes scabra]|uniref:Uncharacterized protein n=1 Tax=Stylosanthes scabra TaxID=79078 RepID=A0ABU6YKU7_9FABA|nr:hypothetical protein [Stylosanthes scabra]
MRTHPTPWCVRTQHALKMARKGSSSLAKGKAIAYGPLTRASPRLAAMRARLVANSCPETPVTHAISTPTSSLPIKKCRTFMQAPKEQGVNAISSNHKPEPAPKDANHETTKMDGDEDEDLKEKPKEVPNVEEEEKPDEEDNRVREHLHGEHNPRDHFVNEISESINVLANNDLLRNYRATLVIGTTRSQLQAPLEAAPDHLLQTARPIIAPH